VSFVAITLCVACQRVFIVVVDLFIDSVRKLLDTPSHGNQYIDIYIDYRSSQICGGCIEALHFTTRSRMTLGSIYTHKQCVLESLPLGYRRPEHEADYSPLYK
jgi:hypothetical protein